MRARALAASRWRTMSDRITDPEHDARAARLVGAERVVVAEPDPAIDAADGSEGAVREVLRDRGLRYSRPREAILAYMAEAPRHASAEALYQALRERGEDVSLSTVYLNLGVLVEAGLLREFKGVHGESLYDASVEPHYHLICRETGEVVDVPMPTSTAWRCRASSRPTSSADRLDGRRGAPEPARPPEAAGAN
jgi:Fe2+ or Zn2+ uptake regulation protein